MAAKSNDDDERKNKSASFFQSFNEAFRDKTRSFSSMSYNDVISDDADDSPSRRFSAPVQGSVPVDISGSSAHLLKRVNELRDQLANHRTARKERATLLSSFDDTARCLRDQLLEEKEPLELAENTCAKADAEHHTALREIEELRESHHKMLSRKATQEAEIRRHTVNVWSEELKLRQATKDREWARDGPETDALKNAKIELAQSLGELDEARLYLRKGLAGLQREVENAEAENLALRKAAEQSPVAAQSPNSGSRTRKLLQAVKSPGQSMWHMLTAGVRKSEPAEEVVRTSS
jgi:chromosome segregation ATPase